jgi:hypothetical protein
MEVGHVIDFSALVLAPCMEVFAAPVVVTPRVSQPQAPAYSARGVWTIKPFDIVTENGGVLSDRDIRLGIRLADFVIEPVEGDWITTETANLPLGYDTSLVVVDFVIDDVTPDGQGGAVLTVKKQTP